MASPLRLLLVGNNVIGQFCSIFSAFSFEDNAKFLFCCGFITACMFTNVSYLQEMFAYNLSHHHVRLKRRGSLIDAFFASSDAAALPYAAACLFSLLILHAGIVL